MVRKAVKPSIFRSRYADVFEGDANGEKINGRGRADL